ncbi:hypothetical protein [Marinobacter sp. ATCH36]|uniref:hypothetical protein n=1 Tax=Marinobacter sp. ATCH36 TaxID=2945106 RepID=UPI002020D98D|nr:hypothetical protein [Marinobacter sp. ATCH36]MCL7944030.1 hypothetical protein [Marinobacter sp. ATCH36]
MSLGNNIDDSDLERSAILKEAAELMVVKGLAKDEAIEMAEQLATKRAEAEKFGQVESDNQGNTVGYNVTALNPEPVPANKREAVNSTYQELCENEGVEAL